MWDEGLDQGVEKRWLFFFFFFFFLRVLDPLLTSTECKRDMSDSEHIFHIVKKSKASIVFVCLDTSKKKKMFSALSSNAASRPVGWKGKMGNSPVSAAALRVMTQHFTKQFTLKKKKTYISEHG